MKKIDVAAIMAGLAAWVSIISIGSWAALHGWPAYAAAAPTHSYTMAKLLTRQIVGAIATLAAGALAARIATAGSRAALFTGAVLLLVSVPWHIRIWPQYPVWYHLLYLGYLLPMAILGGRMARGDAG